MFCSYDRRLTVWHYVFVTFEETTMKFWILSPLRYLLYTINILFVFKCNCLHFVAYMFVCLLLFFICLCLLLVIVFYHVSCSFLSYSFFFGFFWFAVFLFSSVLFLNSVRKWKYCKFFIDDKNTDFSPNTTQGLKTTQLNNCLGSSSKLDLNYIR